MSFWDRPIAWVLAGFLAVINLAAFVLIAYEFLWHWAPPHR